MRTTETPGSEADWPGPEQLGATVRQVRLEHELSVERLAQAADIHWTYLSGIERGIRNPSWNVLCALAEALGMRTSELARRVEDVAEVRGSDS